MRKVFYIFSYFFSFTKVMCYKSAIYSLFQQRKHHAHDSYFS